MTQLEFEQKVKELLTIPTYEEWLLGLPKENKMLTVALASGVVCGCPLATYLRVKGLGDAYVTPIEITSYTYEKVEVDGSLLTKIADAYDAAAPAWVGDFIDLADSIDYPAWGEQTAAHCLEIVEIIKARE